MKAFHPKLRNLFFPIFRLKIIFRFLFLNIILLANVTLSSFSINVDKEIISKSSNRELLSVINTTEITAQTTEAVSTTLKRKEFALVKGVDPAYIVLARSEHSGVHAAARDLQRDITKITGVTPNIVHSLKETSGRCVVIGSADCLEGKDLLASVGVSVDDLEGKWELFKYQILNDVGDKEQVLAIAGSNLRGTIFGIYDFEQKHLEVDPLWFWADHEPPTRGELIFDDRINFSSLKEPTWKYRGWTLNDHPQLIEWMETGLVQRARYGRYMFVIHPEVFERFYEAALRLKMNMFTWYFIDVDWKPDWEQLKAQVSRGLFITQHQMEGLGADAGFWNNYWDNHNPKGKPAEFSYLKYPEAFREFWSHYVKRLVEFSPHVVWELNQRGWADAPYTEITLPDGGTDQQRAEIISAAIAEQAKLVSELDPNPDLEMMTTLYAEVGRFYDSGWIKVPPEVTIGFGDAGMSGMSYSKKFWTEKRDPNRKYGQYFHTNYFGGGPQVAKCTPIDTYLKVNMDAMYERGDTEHMLLAMNELRCQQLEIRGVAEMLWDYPGFEYREYLLRYCRENFGNEAAPKVAALYDEYYAKYPHSIRNDGFKTYPFYYKVMEPLFTIISNLIHIEGGNTDGYVINYQYNREIYEKGIKDLGEVLEKAVALRPSIPENRKYFFDYEFLDAIRLIRGIYKLGIAVNDAIASLNTGDKSAALAALIDAQPLTIELYEAFSNQKGTDKWKYWYRSSTNKDFYLLYNAYQKARLYLETESMNIVTDIEPQRRPFRGNIVMDIPAKEGDAIYCSQSERINSSVWNGAPYSICEMPIKGVFQIQGIISVYEKGAWQKMSSDHGENYEFTLKGRSTVYVACDKNNIPDWLENEGFISTNQSLKVGHWNWPYRYQNRPPSEILEYVIFSKEFAAGKVTLGKNPDKGLTYIVFVKPQTLVFENFRDTDFNTKPANWLIRENGGSVRVVDIPEYDGELRPSVFDLTTVPRYTPLDLRGLKLEARPQSLSFSTAELSFTKPVNDDFILNIRLKTGQDNNTDGFMLSTTDGKKALEIILNDKGKIMFSPAKGKKILIGNYSEERWYNIIINLSPEKGKLTVEIQDDKLNVISVNNLNTGLSKLVIGKIGLKHSNEKEGSWILYNAINAYLK